MKAEPKGQAGGRKQALRDSQLRISNGKFQIEIWSLKFLAERAGDRSIAAGSFALRALLEESSGQNNSMITPSSGRNSSWLPNSTRFRSRCVESNNAARHWSSLRLKLRAVALRLSTTR